MKIVIANILIFLLVVGTISCKENSALEYENDPALYFENTTYGQRDSIAHTFFIQPDDQMRDTVFIEILTMGYPTDSDRPFILEQTNAGQPGSAIAGKHFVAFDSEEARKLMVIPAGEVSANIPIILLRDVSLKEEIYYLTLQLIENDEFKIGGVTKDVEYAITFADKLIKPNFWDLPYQGSYYFGKYSMRKHEFMIEVAGGKIDDEWWRSLYGASSVTGLLAYYQSKFKTELDKYNSDPENIANGLAPMREIVGDPTSNLVTF